MDTKLILTMSAKVQNITYFASAESSMAST